MEELVKSLMDMQISRLKKFLAYIALAVVALGMINSGIMPTRAWKNGSYADDPADYDYATDYSTHDWIADNALDYLLAHNSSQWAWLDSRREIFYLGTEAPDNGGIDITLNGTAVTGFGDTAKHHIYFYENGSIFANEDDAAIRAKWCADWADVYITEGNWDAAAYFLGAMTHYIADMGVYAHVAQNNVAPYYIDFDEHHSTLEGYVDTRTNEVDDPEEFFNITLPGDIGALAPYNAAVQVAWDTYKDPAPTEAYARDAVWLHENFFSSWALTQEQRAAEVNATRIAYYGRIEQNLMQAMGGCISAMLYVGMGIEDNPPGGDTDDSSDATTDDTAADDTAGDDSASDDTASDDANDIGRFLSLPFGGAYAAISAVTVAALMLAIRGRRQ